MGGHGQLARDNRNSQKLPAFFRWTFFWMRWEVAVAYSGTKVASRAPVQVAAGSTSGGTLIKDAGIKGEKVFAGDNTHFSQGIHGATVAQSRDCIQFRVAEGSKFPIVSGFGREKVLFRFGTLSQGTFFSAWRPHVSYRWRDESDGKRLPFPVSRGQISRLRWINPRREGKVATLIKGKVKEPFNEKERKNHGEINQIRVKKRRKKGGKGVFVFKIRPCLYRWKYVWRNAIRDTTVRSLG